MRKTNPISKTPKTTQPLLPQRVTTKNHPWTTRKNKPNQTQSWRTTTYDIQHTKYEIQTQSDRSNAATQRDPAAGTREHGKKDGSVEPAKLAKPRCLNKHAQRSRLLRMKYIVVQNKYESADVPRRSWLYPLAYSVIKDLQLGSLRKPILHTHQRNTPKSLLHHLLRNYRFSCASPSTSKSFVDISKLEVFGRRAVKMAVWARPWSGNLMAGVLFQLWIRRPLARLASEMRFIRIMRRCLKPVAC